MLVFDGGTKLEHLEETDGNTAGKILAAPLQLIVALTPMIKNCARLDLTYPLGPVPALRPSHLPRLLPFHIHIWKYGVPVLVQIPGSVWATLKLRISRAQWIPSSMPSKSGTTK